MLDPDYLEHCADGIIELYSKLDEDIARDIARRIVKTGEITDTAKWQLQKLQEGGVVFDDAIKSISKYSGAGEEALADLFEKAGAKSIAFDNAIYAKAGLTPLSKMSPAVLNALEAGLKKTGGSIDNLVMSTAVQAQNSYFNACDRAYMQVSSGAFDYITAIRNAVKSASAEGTSVLYPSGHVDKLDVAIRRAVITGVSQTALRVSDINADAMGCDLVEVTAHAGARPEHAAWQGKVYSRSGKNKKYPPFSITGYGTGAGLGGWNCRHAFYPFFEGVSTRAYTSARIEELNNKTVEYNGETMSVYDASQQQRAMERQMRKERRAIAGIDEAMKSTSDKALRNGLKEDFEAASVKLKGHEAQYKDFSRQVKLPIQDERLQVAGYGKSVSQKAVHAAKGPARGTDMAQAPAYFVNHNEKLYKYAQKLKPQKGFFDVVCHADSTSFEIRIDDETTYNMTPEEFAMRIKESMSYKGGNIRLISCNSGAKADGAAQQVANILGVDVLAPTEAIHVSDIGEYFISNNDILAEMWLEGYNVKSTGKMRLFKPERK